MIKSNYHYSNPSRLDRMLTSTRNSIKFLSELTGKLVGKLAESLAYMVFSTAALAIPLALWLGIPAAVSMCFDGPVDTQGKAFALLGAFAAWNVLCFLVGMYLDRPGKPISKKH